MFRPPRWRRKEFARQELVVIVIILLSVPLLINLHQSQTSNGNLSSNSAGRKIESVRGKNLEEVENSTKNVQLKRLPQAVIIGSRKSGTRALLQFLQLNPSIRSAKREIHFFDRQKNFKFGLDWYRNQMPNSFKNQTTIEKTPNYFVSNGVAERMRAMNSSLKLILILRDPVTRLISDYSQLTANKIEFEADKNGQNLSSLGINRNKNDEDFYEKSLDDYANADEQQQPTDDYEHFWQEAELGFEDYVKRQDGGINDQRRAVRIGMYSNYLEKWRLSFKAEQFHIVDGERLISNPAEELRKVEQFLNLKPSIGDEDFVFDHKKGFFCLRVKTKSTMTENSTHQNGQINSKKINCLSKNKGRRHVRVKPELIKKLREFYAPYNDYLYSMINQNLNWPS